MSSFGGGRMSDERKKQIADRMKNMLEKTYTLTFNKSESIFKEDERLEAPGTGRGFGMMGSFNGGTQYKNVKEVQVIQEQEFFGKQFLVKDALEKLDWKMESETKTIGKYTCFKATAVKTVSESDWANRRRPSRDRDSGNNKGKDSISKKENEKESVETPKQIIVTAWYTPQIPVSQGPSDYWGLPGLILEINAGRTTILCSKIVINPSEKEVLKVPSKGKEVTRKAYNDIVKKKVEEMRSMRGRRGGSGFRH